MGSDQPPISNSSVPIDGAPMTVPKPVARWKRWQFWLSLCGTLMLVVLVVAFCFAAHFQLSHQVRALGGTVEWNRAYLGLSKIVFNNGGANDEWLHRQDWRRLRTIQHVMLKRCDITRAGLQSLLPLIELQSLDLEGCRKIAPADLETLQGFSNLKHLFVDSLLLDRSGAIEQFSQLKQLEVVSFYGRVINQEKLNELQVRMPKTRFEVLDPTGSSMGFRPVKFDAVPRVMFHPDGQRLAVGDGHGRLRLMRASDQSVIWEVTAHPDWIFGVAFDPTGTLLASAGGDNDIRLWNVADHRHLATLEGHDDDAHTLAFDPSGAALFSSSDDMTVRRWDLSALKTALVASTDEPLVWNDSEIVVQEHEDTIPALTLSSDGRWLASGSRDGTIRLRDMSDRSDKAQRLTHSLHKRPNDLAARLNPELPRGDVMGLSFDRESNTLASIGYDGRICLWDFVTQAPMRQWKAHDGWAFCVEYAPSGDRLASGGRAGVVVLWNAFGHEMQRFRADDDVACVTFSPDGRRLAASTASGAIYVWTLSN